MDAIHPGPGRSRHHFAKHVAIAAAMSCALVASFTPSSARAQYDGGLDGLAAAGAVSVAFLAVGEAVTLIGGIVSGATGSGRRGWLIANAIVAVLDGAFAIVLAASGREQVQPWALPFGAASLCHAATATVLGIDLSDDVAARPVVLQDVRGDLAPGVGLRVTL